MITSQCARRGIRRLALILVPILMVLLGVNGAAGGDGHGVGPAGSAMEGLHHWNQVAIDGSGLDHTPVAPGENRVFGEQLGPCRASRAMAIVHIAVFEAINAISGGYRSYVGLDRAPANASMKAAIGKAACDTLVHCFPSQAHSFDAQLVEDLASIPNGRAKTDGVEVGRRAAAAILSMRSHDGSEHAEPIIGVDYFPGFRPGDWRRDPISRSPVALGAFWDHVDPFVLRSASHFRVAPPPPLESRAYAVAFNEAKRLGGDGITTPTARTLEQTMIGIYWAYDGTPSLCAPPRLYNQLTMRIATQQGTSVVELARLLALVNMGLSDAASAVWDSKYYYRFWRPVTGIREADARTGPTGIGDRNPLTAGDRTFSPLGAPASNLTGPNFTPPFPSYPSGHAGLGGAVFQILRRFYGTDRIAFTFISDELNGITVNHDGSVRPLAPRSFRSFSEAEEENGQSRIYLGIHWSFDKSEGIAQGRRVGNYVFDHAFRPTRR